MYWSYQALTSTIEMPLRHDSANCADNTNAPCKPQLFQHLSLKLHVSQLLVHTYQCCLENLTRHKNVLRFPLFHDPGHSMQ